MATATIEAEVPQHMQALDRANDKRVAISRELANLRRMSPPAGKRRTQAILRNPGPTIAGIAVRRLLLATPRIGEQRAQRCLLHAGVANGDTKVGSLTHEQRARVAASLDVPFCDLRVYWARDHGLTEAAWSAAAAALEGHGLSAGQARLAAREVVEAARNVMARP